MALRSDLNIPVRVAVVQLNGHQAATIGGRDFAGEPIVDDLPLPIDHLIRTGLLDLDHARAEIRSHYHNWHRDRLRSVLTYLEQLSDEPIQLDPIHHSPSSSSDRHSGQHNAASPRPFLLVVFPEYSIPFELLSDIRDWADRYYSPEPVTSSHHSHCFAEDEPATCPSVADSRPILVLFAGTHSLPERTEAVVDTYRQLGFDEVDDSGDSSLEYAYRSPLPSRSVLPMFYYDWTRRKVRARMKLKRVLSPFELTHSGSQAYDVHELFGPRDVLRVPVQLNWSPHDVTSPSVAGQARPRSTPSLPASDGHRLQMTFLPLICSEALQTIHSTEVDCDIAVIPSYNHRPDDFDHVIEHVSKLQRLVVFCNDGRYGGSRFAMPPSLRGEGWWLGHPNHGKLPRGDAIIVADVAPMDLADRTLVNNPSEHCQLQRLAAIVPKCVDAHSFIVSQCLNALRERESSRDKDGGTIDLSFRKMVLTECLEYRTPTELQRIKIERLLTLRDIDKRLWALYGSDVVFEHGDGGGDTFPLEELERRFLASLIKIISDMQSEIHLTAEQHRAIAKALEVCRSRQRLGRAPSEYVMGGRLLTSAQQNLRKQSDRSRADAQQCLANHVAELVERYQAASAWLYLYAPGRYTATGLPPVSVSRPLQCVVAHNALQLPDSVQALDVDENAPSSMAAACVACSDIVLYPLLVERFGTVQYSAFVRARRASRSAVCIPISAGRFVPRGVNAKEGLVGVLVLESGEPYAFSYADACELLADARPLLLPLTYLRASCEGLTDSLIWYPPTMSWCVSGPLNALCHDVASALPGAPGQPKLGLTVWCADSEPVADSVRGMSYALGAVRFDADYLSQRMLGTWSVSAAAGGVESVESNCVVPDSFVGEMLCSPPGTTFSDDWRRIRRFVRQEKAVRAELEWVFATNFADGTHFFPARPFRPIAHASSRHCNVDNKGVVCLYTYHGTTESLRRFLTPPRLRSFARLVERLLARNTIAMASLASCALDAQLRTLALTGQNTFNIIRDFVSDTLHSDGCSIFVLDGSKVNCVASTGLNQNGREVLRETASYDIEADAAPSSHLTCELLRRALLAAKGKEAEELDNVRSRYSVFRVNRQTAAVRRSPPSSARLLESITLTDAEHRRAMYLVVWRASDYDRRSEVPWGIVRVTRSARKQPFNRLDAIILEQLSGSIAAAFELRAGDRSRAKRKRGLQELQACVSSYESALEEEVLRASASEGSDRAGQGSVAAALKRRDLFQNAIERLFTVPSQFQQWTRRRIEAILEDLFFSCDDVLPVLATFRTAVREGVAGANLRVHAVHGYSQLELTESAVKGLREVEGGIGWDCCHRRSCIRFARSDTGFTTTFRDCQRATESGLCLSMVLPFERDPMIGVLSIEVNREDSALQERHRRLICAAAIQIANAAIDQSLPMCVGEWQRRYDGGDIGRDFIKSLNAYVASLPIDSSEIRTEFDRWGLGVTINAVGIEASRDRVTSAAINTVQSHLASELFDPLGLLPKFVSRDAPPDTAPSNPHDAPNAFGRVSPTVESELGTLSNLGVRLDLDRGAFLLPLWIAGARCGTLVGIRDAGMPFAADCSSSEQAQLIFRIVREFSWQWTLFYRQWEVALGSLDCHWGIRFVDRSSGQEGDSARLEWRLDGYFCEE